MDAGPGRSPKKARIMNSVPASHQPESSHYEPTDPGLSPNASTQVEHQETIPGGPRQTHRSLQAYVVNYVQGMIERGELKLGDRLPPERNLAVRLGISRSSLRAGIQSLAALGVLKVRPGTGTFVTDGAQPFDGPSLGAFADLHGFTMKQMFEARLILEKTIASLAAQRATEKQLAALAEGVAEMYASLEDPREYLVHDICFHRDLSAAAGNVILTTLAEIVTAVLYQRRRETVDMAQDLKQSAELHREIYRAVRSHKPDDAAEAMERHLKLAEKAISEEKPLTTDRTRSMQSQGPDL